jgi:hypothetical protein
MLRYLTAKNLLILVAILIGLDIAISLFSTCNPIGQYGSAKQPYEKECTAFSGPLVGYLLGFLTWVGHILHEFDKEIVALFTTILTLSTVALWWSTRRLYLSGERQIQVSERALDAADRPWVGQFGDIEIGLGGTQMTIGVNFKNYGRSPALRIRSIVGFVSGPVGLPPPTSIADMSRSTSVQIKFPGETFFSKPYGSLPPVSDWDKIVRGERSMWVFGRIEYSGQSGADYRTVFCSYYKAGYGGMVPTEDNEAT